MSTLRPDLAAFLQFDLESEKNGYVATRVMPVIDTALQSDNPGRIPLAQLLQAGNTNRSSGGGYARGKYTFEKFTYACEEHGWEEPVDDRQRKQYQHLFDAEKVATARAFSKVLRNAEQRVASAVFNATTFSSYTAAVSTEWSTVATATPLTDVNTAVNAVYNNSGLWANALIVNRKVFRNLRRCAQVIDAIEASGAGSAAKQSDITADMLAQVFDLDYVIVAGTSKNSATEGQTATPAQIWDSEYAMVCRVATSNDIQEPCLARMFHWTEDGSTIGGTVEQYRDETIRSDIYRVRHDVDEVIMYAAAGYLLSNITA